MSLNPLIRVNPIVFEKILKVHLIAVFHIYDKLMEIYETQAILHPLYPKRNDFEFI